ncbi:MAG: lysophospholipid acyltransferase family protein [Mesorhizobium sp.]
MVAADDDIGRTRIRARRPASASKRFWRRVRKPVADSWVTKWIIAGAFTTFQRLILATNRIAPGSRAIGEMFADNSSVIIALWHGQHFTGPVYLPKDTKVVALVSKSADAELNAAVLERLGVRTVRGSGGRDREQSIQKGGARALIALKRALAQGNHVCMIADIPHGTPREAGLGIVTLAKISGSPIVCFALATSGRKVLERTWDKSTFSLPFGRTGIDFADPIRVPANATDEELEAYRREVTQTMNRVTDRAYELVDGGA